MSTKKDRLFLTTENRSALFRSSSVFPKTPPLRRDTQAERLAIAFQSAGETVRRDTGDPRRPGEEMGEEISRDKEGLVLVFSASCMSHSEWKRWNDPMSGCQQKQMVKEFG